MTSTEVWRRRTSRGGSLINTTGRDKDVGQGLLGFAANQHGREDAISQHARDAERDFGRVIDSLNDSINPLRWMAFGAFSAAAAVLVFVLWRLPALTREGVAEIAANPTVPAVAIYELVRGAAFAAAVTAVIWALLSMGRACLDQATRFQKRLIAAHFLNFSLHAYQAKILSGEMRLEEVVGFLKSWSENVESAFTNVKIGGKGQDMRVSVTKDGATVGTGRGAAPETTVPVKSREDSK